MTLALTTDQVWKEIENNLFAVLGMVTRKGEARTVGIVYVVDGCKFYIGSQKAAWKVKHIAHNPGVSLTIPIAKRIALMPWIKIPAATITLSGTANLRENSEVKPQVLQKLYRDMVKDENAMAASCVIEVIPEREFLTYGVGVSLLEMRDPHKAMGRAPVTTARQTGA